MRLTVDGKRIAIRKGAKISIEIANPLLNDDAGEFSYPFPVPREENEAALGYPGKLTRTNSIPKQDFILEEHEFQILKGEIDYDPVNDGEIPAILKSGYTKFRGKMAGRKLNEVSYGYETGLPDTSDQNDFAWKLGEVWDDANRTDNGKYVMAPSVVKGEGNDEVAILVNKLNYTTGMLTFNSVPYFSSAYFMFQFYAWFILEKIFESAGYTVVINELKTVANFDLLVFSKVFKVRKKGIIYWIEGMKTDENLYYSKLMPDMTVLQFVDKIMNFMCMSPIFDERNKRVAIIFNGDVFSPANVVKINFIELPGWEHSEDTNEGGIKVGYASQDNDQDTKDDYEIERLIVGMMPAAEEEGEIVRQDSIDKDWQAVTDGDILKWEEIGRLKPFKEGNESEGVEFDVKVPTEEAFTGSGGLPIPVITVKIGEKTKAIENVTELYVSLYRGLITPNVVGIPYITSISMTGNDASLKPKYMYEHFHKEFLQWKAYRAKAVTKYFSMELPDVLSLRQDKTYIINGVKILIDKVNFDVPFDGVVKIGGWTV